MSEFCKGISQGVVVVNHRKEKRTDSPINLNKMRLQGKHQHQKLLKYVEEKKTFAVKQYI